MKKVNVSNCTVKRNHKNHIKNFHFNQLRSLSNCRHGCCSTRRFGNHT